VTPPTVDRDQIATRLVLAYWLTLVGGLVLFTTTRFDDSAAVTALWIGALGGTMLGQYLALRDYRLWIVVLIVVLSALYGAPLVPAGPAGSALWQAFIPAVLCGFWSLGDRASIVACWFPAVIWMLSILDRADGKLAPDGVGVTLLATFALAFFAILRARETRRVALWRAVGAAPIAPETPAEILRESPGRQLARAGWGLSVGAISVALTVWIAPRLWRLETLDGPAVHVASPSRRHGLPCCPVDREAETTSSRVKEYFDLGRGHNEQVGPSHEGVDCRVCTLGVAIGAEPGVVGDGGWPVETVVRPEMIDDDAGRGSTGPGVTRDYVAGPITGGAQIPPPVVAAPPPVIAAPPPGVAAPPPVVAAPVAPPPPTVTRPTPPLPTMARHPAMAPQAVPDVPQPEAPSVAPQRTASPGGGGLAILPWLAALATGALMFQLVALGLRPIRRMITLRHLRRPFWDETVDQRVSNAWQLALVGLRDAGWRPSTSEAPQALARRVGVAELAACATILERARHGLGIDAEDLEAMGRAADAAYHAARRELGVFARVVGWIRWPLA
jgi:hypothetical protein